MLGRIDETNIIQINRGDDADFTFTIDIGTPLWPIIGRLDEGEYVYMGIMEYNQPWEEAIIRKKFSKEDSDYIGRIHIHINSQDTENLHPGTYWCQFKGYFYDVELKKYVVNTLTPRTKFIIY